MTLHPLEEMAKEVDAHLEWIKMRLAAITQAELDPSLAEQISPEQ